MNGQTLNRLTNLFSANKVSRNVDLGEDVRLRGVIVSGRVSIGGNTIVNMNTIIRASAGTARINIGKFCSIAHDVFMCTYNHSINTPSIWSTKDNSVKFFELFPVAGKHDSKDISIGNDVWIGAKVSIMPSVTIGNGAVIGANSVVAKDVAPYSIVAGIPAKPLKQRFSAQTIDFLQKLNWWEWDSEKMYANKVFFNSDLTKMTPSEINTIIR
jgi:virginiamycin A acetyltransferase